LRFYNLSGVYLKKKQISCRSHADPLFKRFPRHYEITCTHKCLSTWWKSLQIRFIFTLDTYFIKREGLRSSDSTLLNISSITDLDFSKSLSSKATFLFLRMLGTNFPYPGLAVGMFAFRSSYVKKTYVKKWKITLTGKSAL
jgi:hypothetical protein